VLRRLHSLTGILPLGVFLVLHLWTNAHALQGQRAFEDAYAARAAIPNLLVLEVCAVWLPLLFHAALGLKLSARARPNLKAYPTSGQWGYVAQRASGVLLLLFLGLHVVEVRLPELLGTRTPEDYHALLSAQLSSTVGPGVPLRALVYLAGLAAACYHLSYGVYGFAFSWGLVGTRRAAHRVSIVAGVLGLALFLLGASTIIFFATGSRWTLEFGSLAGGGP
jgi:succinate dehydrogenase/fumarate reductase cytochrome b subunit (b558 family)